MDLHRFGTYDFITTPKLPGACIYGNLCFGTYDFITTPKQEVRKMSEYLGFGTYDFITTPKQREVRAKEYLGFGTYDFITTPKLKSKKKFFPSRLWYLRFYHDSKALTIYFKRHFRHVFIDLC